MTSDQRGFLRRYFGDLSLTRHFAVADTTITSLSVKNASYTIYVQRIVVNISTSAAFTLIIRDSASTPLVLFEIPSDPGEGEFAKDFGDTGLALTEGKNLDFVLSGAGLVGSITVEAYQKPTAASREVASA